MSIFNIIILIGAIQGLFLALLIESIPKDQKLSHRWLAVFLVLYSLSMIYYVIWDSRIILEYPKLTMISVPLELLLGVSFYFYICSITEKKFEFKRIQLLHFAPTILTVLAFIPFYLKTDQYKINFNLESYRELPDRWKYYFLFTLVSNSTYILISWLKISKHKRLLKEYYSNETQSNLKWIERVFISMLIIFITCVIISIYGYNYANQVSNILFSIGVYTLGYLGFRQKAPFAGIREEINKDEVIPAVLPKAPEKYIKYEKSGLSEEKARDLLGQLDQLISNEKPYLKQDINLQQLADELNISIHHLSQLINQYKHTNFYDFINSCRIEEFKQKVGDPKFRHLSILGIAFECGFNSKASFNEAFKKQTGLTPSEYRKSLLP